MTVEDCFSGIANVCPMTLLKQVCTTDIFKRMSDLFRDSYLTKHVKLFRFWWGSTTATAELYSGKYSNYFKSTGKPQNDLKMNRSIRPNVFYKKSFPRNFAKFT